MDVPYIELPIDEVRAILDARRAEGQVRLDAIEAHPLWPLADPEKAYGDDWTWWPEEMRQVEVPPELAKKWRAGEAKRKGWFRRILSWAKKSAWLPVNGNNKVDFMLVESTFRKAREISRRAPRINGVPLAQATDAELAMANEIKRQAESAKDMRAEFYKARDVLIGIAALTTSVDELEGRAYQTAVFLESEMPLLRGATEVGGLSIGFDDYLAAFLADDTQKQRHSELLSRAHRKERKADAAFYASLERVRAPEALAAILAGINQSSFAAMALDWVKDGEGAEIGEDAIRLWRKTERTISRDVSPGAWTSSWEPGINILLDDSGGIPEDCLSQIAHECRHRYQYKVFPHVREEGLTFEKSIIEAFIRKRLMEADAYTYGGIVEFHRLGKVEDNALLSLVLGIDQYVEFFEHNMANVSLHKAYDKPFMTEDFLTVLTEGRLRDMVEKSPLTQIETLDRLLSFKEGRPGLLAAMTKEEQAEFRARIVEGLCTVDPPAAILERFHKAAGKPQQPVLPVDAKAAFAENPPAPI